MDDNTSLLRLLISNPPMFILAMVAIIVGGASYLAHRFVPARKHKTDEHRQAKPDLMEINRQLTESLATMTRLYQDAIREQARRDADVKLVE